MRKAKIKRAPKLLLDLEFARSIVARFDGLFNNVRLANDISAVTRVIIILNIIKIRIKYHKIINEKNKNFSQSRNKETYKE